METKRALAAFAKDRDLDKYSTSTKKNHKGARELCPIFPWAPCSHCYQYLCVYVILKNTSRPRCHPYTQSVWIDRWRRARLSSHGQVLRLVFCSSFTMFHLRLCISLSPIPFLPPLWLNTLKKIIARVCQGLNKSTLASIHRSSTIYLHRGAHPQFRATGALRHLREEGGGKAGAREGGGASDRYRNHQRLPPSLYCSGSRPRGPLLLARRLEHRNARHGRPFQHGRVCPVHAGELVDAHGAPGGQAPTLLCGLRRGGRRPTFSAGTLWSPSAQGCWRGTKREFYAAYPAMRRSTTASPTAEARLLPSACRVFREGGGG